jgi:hypothetical protein
VPRSTLPHAGLRSCRCLRSSAPCAATTVRTELEVAAPAAELEGLLGGGGREVHVVRAMAIGFQLCSVTVRRVVVWGLVQEGASASLLKHRLSGGRRTWGPPSTLRPAGGQAGPDHALAHPLTQTSLECAAVKCSYGSHPARFPCLPVPHPVRYAAVLLAVQCCHVPTSRVRSTEWEAAEGRVLIPNPLSDSARNNHDLKTLQHYISHYDNRLTHSLSTIAECCQRTKRLEVRRHHQHALPLAPSLHRDHAHASVLRGVRAWISRRASHGC